MYLLLFQMQNTLKDHLQLLQTAQGIVLSARAFQAFQTTKI